MMFDMIKELFTYTEEENKLYNSMFDNDGNIIKSKLSDNYGNLINIDSKYRSQRIFLFVLWLFISIVFSVGSMIYFSDNLQTETLPNIYEMIIYPILLFISFRVIQEIWYLDNYLCRFHDLSIIKVN